MIKIVSDSSTLYSKEEAKKNNLDVRSLSVTIDNKSFKELEELTTEGLVKLIEEGAVPSSSQPAIGDVVEMYEEYPDAEIINISMADGLSGTYQSACMAKTMVDHGDKLTARRLDLCVPTISCVPLRCLRASIQSNGATAHLTGRWWRA